ncbi:MAG: glutaredoxin domain-containing protein [Candidatus Bruticola sp.]
MSESMLTNEGVEIFTWEHCPYCQRAKHILEGDPNEGALNEGEYIEYKEYKIDGSAEKRAYMAQCCEGNMTVPQIFVDGNYIGGCFNLVALILNNEFRQVFAKYIKNRN